MDDILESIEELKLYKNTIFKSPKELRTVAMPGKRVLERLKGTPLEKALKK